MTTIRREMEDYRLLLRSVPSLVVTVFVLSVVLMNLLANKEFVSYRYLALDCGFVLSWISFLCMDIICKHFGPRPAVKTSLLAVVVNLFVCLIFKVISLSPGMWGEYYSSESIQVNEALNATIGGTWYVLLGSSTAMLCGALTNAGLNHMVASGIDFGGFKAFALRSYISTCGGQFVDNFVFSTIVSVHFFGWSWVQVFFCSVTGAVMELLCEVIFSPMGYRICERWERENVGETYLEYIRAEEN